MVSGGTMDTRDGRCDQEEESLGSGRAGLVGERNADHDEIYGWARSASAGGSCSYAAAGGSGGTRLPIRPAGGDRPARSTTSGPQSITPCGPAVAASGHPPTTTRVTSDPSRHNLRTRTGVTARNHRRITAPHTRTFSHGEAPRRLRACMVALSLFSPERVPVSLSSSRQTTGRAPRDDDTAFGILHSRFHEVWSLRLLHVRDVPVPARPDAERTSRRVRP